LRDTRQTYADLEFRMRASLRGDRIEARAMAPAGDDAQEGERLRLRYVRRLYRRWRERTTCARRYRIKDCRDYRR